jgi:hypothetical protein
VQLEQSPFIAVESSTKVRFHLPPLLVVECRAMEDLVNLQVVADLLSFEIVKRTGGGFMHRQ